MKYKTKPCEIEAIQWDGMGETFNKLVEFVGDNLDVIEHGKVPSIFEKYEMSIKTLEGTMRVSPYDYIIKGLNGEFYPCKQDIFEKKYEPI